MSSESSESDRFRVGGLMMCCSPKAVESTTHSKQ